MVYFLLENYTLFFSGTHAPSCSRTQAVYELRAFVKLLADISQRMVSSKSLLLISVIVVYALDQTIAVGNYGYYLSGYPAFGGGLVSFVPVLKPDCDKSKDGSESSSSSGSSSSENSSESKESGSSSEESKSNLKEGEASSGSEEGASKEEKKKEEGSEEGGGGESKEKEEAPKENKSKETKYVFPPPSYTFPQRQVQQIVYSPGAPFNYMPYRMSYMVQQPVTSYPFKTKYQYMSLPASTTIAKTYASPVVSRIVASPVSSRIVYSAPAISYPSVSKTILTPGAQVYSTPVAWNSPVIYQKI